MIDRVCISLNNQCNLQCKYCNFRQNDLITNDEDLSKNDIIIILQNILDYSRHYKINQFKIGLVGAGEPLLSFNKIKLIIEYARANDTDNILLFYTITNGILINETMLNYFYDNKDKITLNISLDGYEELHNFGKQSFNETFKAIKSYTALFMEVPTISCNVSKKTVINKERVLQFFINCNLTKINFTQLVDVKDEELLITYSEFLSFLQYINESSKIKYRQNRKQKKYDCRIYGQLCGVGRTGIFISKQGIYPCCRFYKNYAFKIVDFDTSLFKTHEQMIKMLKPISDGKCYFNEIILQRSDL